jgi:hypothetical protein
MRLHLSTHTNLLRQFAATGSCAPRSGRGVEGGFEQGLPAMTNAVQSTIDPGGGERD